MTSNSMPLAHKKRRRDCNREDCEESVHTIHIQSTLDDINELLQQETLSQKETWKLGKRIKNLMEKHPEMDKTQIVDGYFLWGTALSRLACQHNDSQLALAAVDKFQEMEALLSSEESVGAVAFSLHASSLLIVAAEKRDASLFQDALTKFEIAVQLNDGSTFETQFQYAKALKEFGDFSVSVQAENALVYFEKALSLCASLESMSQTPSHVPPDEDAITEQDIAQVKLLEASICASTTALDQASFSKVYSLYRQAFETDRASDTALLEMLHYTAASLEKALFLGSVKPIVHELDEFVSQFAQSLHFDMTQFKSCAREAHSELTDEDDVDECIPHVLDAFGNLLQSYFRYQTIYETEKIEASSEQVQRAINILRKAHHYHDRLGCYTLAKLFACPGIANEQKCRHWLENAYNYGLLDDTEMLEQEFKTMAEKQWFQTLTTLVNEQIAPE